MYMNYLDIGLDLLPVVISEPIQIGAALGAWQCLDEKIGELELEKVVRDPIEIFRQIK